MALRLGDHLQASLKGVQRPPAQETPFGQELLRGQQQQVRRFSVGACKAGVHILSLLLPLVTI
jgi:hypothetical protein